MPLPESRTIPREQAPFLRRVGRELVHLLTAGAVAILLAILGLLDVLEAPEFALGFCVVLLLVVWAEYRAGQRLVDQLQVISDHEYRQYPQLDEGIDLIHLRWAGQSKLPVPLLIPVPPPAPYLLVQGSEAFTLQAAFSSTRRDDPAAGTGSVERPEIVHQFAQIAYVSTDGITPDGRIDLTIVASSATFALRAIEWASSDAAQAVMWPREKAQT